MVQDAKFDEIWSYAAVSRGLGRGLAVGVNVKVDRGDGVGLAVGVRLLVEARRPNVLRAGESGSLQASRLERLQVGWSWICGT